MPFDENGNFTRLYGATGWQDDRDANTKILASRHDDDANDTAAALNQAFLADGRKTASGPFKMGGYRVKGLGDGQEAQDAPTVKQVQSGTFNYGADVSQEANALKVNLAPAPQSLPTGMFLCVKVAHSNTGKTTLQLNTLPAKPVYLNDQDLCEGMLQAGQVYIFFYNKVLDAFQLLPTGAPVGAAVPPFTLIVLDHLLSGDAAIGWELQGTRCYKSKYWEQYQQLAKEYAEAVERTEEVEGEQFAYKVNLTTLRRFYTKNAYDQRFALCGDSGGYVLDEETYSFYLPKSNNYLRPAVDADNLGAYQEDTLRRMQGTVGMIHLPGRGNNTLTSAPFKVSKRWNTSVGQDGDAGNERYVVDLDTELSGSHFAGAETAPKSRFVAVYYKMGSFYTEQISSAVLAAEHAAQQAEQAVSGIAGQVEQAQAEALKAQTSANEAATSAGLAKQYSSGALGVLTNKGVVKFRLWTAQEFADLPSKDPDKLYFVEEA